MGPVTLLLPFYMFMAWFKVCVLKVRIISVATVSKGCVCIQCSVIVNKESKCFRPAACCLHGRLLNHPKELLRCILTAPGSPD